MAARGPKMADGVWKGEALAKEDPIAAHAYFIDTVIPILENLVPLKTLQKKKSKIQRSRKLLWRKLGKISIKIAIQDQLPSLLNFCRISGNLNRN